VKQVTLDLIPRKINAFFSYRGKYTIKFYQIYSEMIARGYGEIKAPMPINI
jgi:hypothetical protein